MTNLIYLCNAILIKPHRKDNNKKRKAKVNCKKICSTFKIHTIMLQHEFESLIGESITEREFNEEINPMYMYTDLNKEDFCKDWMKHHGSVILKQLTDAVNARDRKNDEQKAIIDRQSQELDHLNWVLKQQKDGLDMAVAEELAKMSVEHENREYARQAISLVGRSLFIKIKLEGGMKLYKDDYEYLIETIGKDDIISMLSSAIEHENDGQKEEGDEESE